MTTITDLTSVEKEWQGKKSTSTTVTLSDGTSGYLDDKNSDKGLQKGDSVDATVITPAGKTYKKVTLKKAQASSQNTPSPAPSNKPSPIPQNSSIEAQKAHAAVSAMEFIVNAVVEGKLDWPQLAEKQREATQILWNEIDEIYNGKI